MIKAASWSEIDCWERSPENWYIAYCLGLKDPANPAMERGSDIHKYLFARPFERENIWRSWQDKYNAGEQRVHKLIQGAYDALVREKLPGLKHEVKMAQDVDGIPTFGYWDGYDEQQGIILEVKTGAKQWSQSDAEKHGQIHLYAAQWQCERQTGMVPTIWLFSASTENGRSTLFKFDPTDKDMMQIRKRLKNFWDGIAEHRENRVMSHR